LRQWGTTDGGRLDRDAAINAQAGFSRLLIKRCLAIGKFDRDGPPQNNKWRMFKNNNLLYQG
jgi:hypothetical protein